MNTIYDGIFSIINDKYYNLIGTGPKNCWSLDIKHGKTVLLLCSAAVFTWWYYQFKLYATAAVVDFRAYGTHDSMVPILYGQPVEHVCTVCCTMCCPNWAVYECKSALTVYRDHSVFQCCLALRHSFNS